MDFGPNVWTAIGGKGVCSDIVCCIGVMAVVSFQFLFAKN